MGNSVSVIILFKKRVWLAQAVLWLVQGSRRKSVVVLIELAYIL
jgi:hypothetical protein